jgi:hypothetical protein
MNDDYVETLIGIKNYLVQHRRSLATQALVSTKQTGTRANELAAAIVTAQNLVEGVARAIADEKLLRGANEAPQAAGIHSLSALRA